MRLGDKILDLSRPQVMAIVNLTEDSFYGGSRCVGDDAVVERVKEAIAQGATIIDVGGYSSRPSAQDVTVEEEWRRVQGGLSAIRKAFPDAIISVDTFRSEVARRALEEFGPLIINDISAGEIDAAMVDVVAQYDVPYVIMHMRGTPQTMQEHTAYPEGVVDVVFDYFSRRIEELKAQGVHRLIIDPGFGFAKSLEQNYELLAGLHRLCDLGLPMLVGVSRKSMIYRVLGVNPGGALNGTTALNWEALRQGVSILRVHDVKEAQEVVALFEQYKKSLSKK